MAYLITMETLKWLDEFMPKDVTYILAPEVKTGDIHVLARYKDVKITRIISYPGDMFDLKRSLIKLGRDVKKKYQEVPVCL